MEDKKVVFYLVLAELIYTIVMGLFYNLFSENFRYGTDLILIAILLVVLFVKRDTFKEYKSRLFGVIYIWILYSIITAIVTRTSSIVIIASLHNWVRGFVFLGICLSLSENTFWNLYKWLRLIFFCNSALVLIQFIFWNMKGDDLVGFCLDNGSTNAFIVALLVFSSLGFFQETQGSICTFALLLLCSVIGALEEIKVLFIELLLIAAVITFFYCLKKVERKIIIQYIVFVVISLCVGLFLLNLIHPFFLSVLTSGKGYIGYEEYSRVSYPYSRLRGIFEINNQLFNNNLIYTFFGVGFGKTFYYGTHAFYACHLKLFFEGGIVGLLLYSMIFIYIIIMKLYAIIKTREITVGRVMLITLCANYLLLIIYDSSLYKEISYVLFWALAAGIVIDREENAWKK